MRDHLDKYLAVVDEFPNKAGHLDMLLSRQKILIQSIIKQKNSDEINKLLLHASESHDITIELLGWMHKIIQEVVNDARHLKEGAEYRNTIELQSDFISTLLDRVDTLMVKK